MLPHSPDQGPQLIGAYRYRVGSHRVATAGVLLHILNEPNTNQPPRKRTPRKPLSRLIFCPCTCELDEGAENLERQATSDRRLRRPLIVSGSTPAYRFRPGAGAPLLGRRVRRRDPFMGPRHRRAAGRHPGGVGDHHGTAVHGAQEQLGAEGTRTLDDHIQDGDIIIVERRGTEENGESGVAVIKGSA